MLKIRLSIAAAALCAGVIAQDSPRAFVEDFSTDPQLRGWNSFGETDLIRWDAAEHNLSVTWDSSRTNSYLRLPLGTIMTRYDDFDVSLDLFLNDFAAGVDPNKPGTFQLAFGFQNNADASSATFLRAVQNAAPNLVEFNFMPDTGFGPTIWPAVMSTNGAMNYSGASDFNIFNLPTSEVMRISLAYRASSETATITITTNGALVGPVTIAHLATNDVAFGKKFTQFKVDTFAIASYSDAGQAGAYGGSILARGTIDNVIINVPPSPILNLIGEFRDGFWETRFFSRTNWLYRLESSADLRSWQEGSVVTGNGNLLTIVQTNIVNGAAFYRVFAQPAE